MMMYMFNLLIILIQEQLAYKSSQPQLKEPSRSTNRVPSRAVQVLHLASPKTSSLLMLQRTPQLTPSTCPQLSTDALQPMGDSHPSTCLQRPSPTLNQPQSLSSAKAKESASNQRNWLLATRTILTGELTTNAPEYPGCQPLGGEGGSRIGRSILHLPTPCPRP